MEILSFKIIPTCI